MMKLRPMKPGFHLSLTACLVVTGILVAACGMNPSLSPGEACGLPRDQWASFGAPVNLSKVTTVWVHPSFSEIEKTAIERAVNQWNALGENALQRPLLQMKVGEFRGLKTSAQVSSCQFAGGDDANFAVLRETDMATWEAMGMTEANPGFTIRCQNSGSQQLVRQAVLINPDLIPEVQLSSVVVHEFGHALGLDHSCQNEAESEDYAGCSGLAGDHPYRQAVMYPVLSVPQNPAYSSRLRRTAAPPVVGTEIKEELQRNDMDRASCLYGRS